MAEKRLIVSRENYTNRGGSIPMARFNTLRQQIDAIRDKQEAKLASGWSPKPGEPHGDSPTEAIDILESKGKISREEIAVMTAYYSDN